MSDWLNNSIKPFLEYEPPIRYYYWSLLSSVSAVLKDHVYFDMAGNYRLYPNLYVLLFGPSGVKKGPPIALARELVTKVDCTRVINGRSTVEGMMKDLATVRTKPNKEIINDNCGFVVASEMSSSMVSSNHSLDVMTDLFDRIYNTGEWDYKLKNEGALSMKRPTITWLAGTNEALFKDFVPEKNLKGGLIGRMFIISETKENTINSLMFKRGEEPDRDKIAAEIKHLKDMKGEVQMSNEVRHAYDNWYVKFKTDIIPKLGDETGTASRLGDSILKVSMILALARRGEMQIKIEDLEEAIREVAPLVIPSKKLAQVNKVDTTTHEKRALIIHELANSPDCKAKRRDLLVKFSMKMDHEDLDRIIIFLEQAGLLVSERINGDSVYGLNLAKEEIRKYVEGYKK